MNTEDFPSDSDSDDQEYCPVNDSGSDSIDEKDEQLIDQEEEGMKTKSKKRRKKLRATRNSKPENDIKEQREESSKPQVDPEEEKKRVDALWADFLSGTDVPAKESSGTVSSKKETATAKSSSQSKIDIPKRQENEQPIKKVFEFAGETIVVEPNGEKKSEENELKILSAPAPTLSLKRPSAGGLSSVLNQFSKKNKLSVLEKTKIDWDGFKSSEGISEELKTHNKGREG